VFKCAGEFIVDRFSSNADSISSSRSNVPVNLSPFLLNLEMMDNAYLRSSYLFIANRYLGDSGRNMTPMTVKTFRPTPMIS
jgi:hypothetical protein